MMRFNKCIELNRFRQHTASIESAIISRLGRLKKLSEGDSMFKDFTHEYRIPGVCYNDYNACKRSKAQ